MWERPDSFADLIRRAMTLLFGRAGLNTFILAFCMAVFSFIFGTLGGYTLASPGF